MTNFYEDEADFCARSKGPLVGRWFEAGDEADICGMDIVDYIESLGDFTPATEESSEDVEYRDERDSSERMAERFSC